MDVIVRKIESTDIPAYRTLRLRGLREHPDAFGEAAESFEERSIDELTVKLANSQKDGGFILGAFVDGEMVGAVALGRESGAKMRHRGTLWGMYVVPEIRGKDLGSQLINSLIVLARGTVGLEQVHLGVATKNLPAFKLYTRMGFKIYGTDPKVLKVNEQYYDEYLMVFDLYPA